jgi:rhodanese-related sulfurtransferase
MKLNRLLIVGIIISIIFFTVYLYTVKSPYLVTADQAKQLLQENKIDVVLDVRTKMEYNLGHYPEALHIPTGDLQDQVETLIPDKRSRILIYCNTGQRARYATDLLKAKGYKSVKYIAGSYLGLLR